MRIPLVLAVAAVAVTLLVALLARGGGDRARAAVVSEPRSEPLPAAAAPAEPAREESAREVDTAQPEPAAKAAAPAPGRTFAVRGTAVDVSGAPLGGVGLAAATDGPSAKARALTGPDGAFAFELPRALADIVATDAGYLVLSGGAFRAEAQEPLRLVLAARGRFEGSVVDAGTGQPVPGALVRAVTPPAVAWSPGEGGEQRTRADGGFTLDAVPVLP